MFDVGSFSLGMLFGIIFGSFLTHALALRREKSKAVWEAASDFREAFVVARKRIEAGENEVQVIEDQFPRHEDARLKYLDYLSGRKAASFDRDWKRYKEWYAVVCNRSTPQVLYESNDPKYLENRAVKVARLIEAVLKHARSS
jgi:hypothetical protein